MMDRSDHTADPSTGPQTTIEDTGTNPWKQRWHSETDVCWHSDYKFFDILNVICPLPFNHFIQF